MLGIVALWMPILISAVFVFIATMMVHMLPGWHQADMAAVPDEDRVMDALRGVNLRPGEYRFPYGNTTKEMEAPAFVAKMNAGPVGIMTIRPTGELPFGKMLGLWFLYVVVVGILTAYVTGLTHGAGAPFAAILRMSSAVAFCCYAVAHWQNWVWWGKSARMTLTYSIDGLIFALVTGATFAWLWPK